VNVLLYIAGVFFFIDLLIAPPTTLKVIHDEGSTKLYSCPLKKGNDVTGVQRLQGYLTRSERNRYERKRYWRSLCHMPPDESMLTLMGMDEMMVFGRWRE
jgi:hypothetical protein